MILENGKLQFTRGTFAGFDALYTYQGFECVSIAIVQYGYNNIVIDRMGNEWLIHTDTDILGIGDTINNAIINAVYRIVDDISLHEEYLTIAVFYANM